MGKADGKTLLPWAALRGHSIDLLGSIDALTVQNQVWPEVELALRLKEGCGAAIRTGIALPCLKCSCRMTCCIMQLVYHRCSPAGAGMGLVSMTTRDELVMALAGRYLQGSRGDHGRMLNKFGALTGHHRKHAMRLPRAGAFKQRSGPGPDPQVDGRATREALIVVWEASDRICGKRLRPLIPILVSAMERHANSQLHHGPLIFLDLQPV